MSAVHIIGGGLAGLAAALSLCEGGRQVTVYEAGPAPGGRCRSYFDRGLSARIDNGNHLLLSGNRAAMAYLDQINARHLLRGSGEAHFPFIDMASAERWTLAFSKGRMPWWMLRQRTRVPGTRLRDYASLLRLRKVTDDVSVAALLGNGKLFTHLVAPVAIAALNTRPERALARVLARVVADTLLMGGAFCVPAFPRIGLSESLVDPAVSFLRARGGKVQLGRRVAALGLAGDTVESVQTTDGPVHLAAGDSVVLAAPPWVAAQLLPGLLVPDEFESIVNVHFVTRGTLGESGFIGLIGGTAEWIFVKTGVVSVTISAANHLVDEPADNLAEKVWQDVRTVLSLPEAMPPARVVKERRATFAATAEQERRRPGVRTRLRNLALAGDWTDTGLPATIEGAIRSGRVAAAHLLAA
jgi:squalene-associated FAD-dependent desaturase